MEPALKRVRTVTPLQRNESVGTEFVRRIPTIAQRHRIRGFNDYVHEIIEMGPLEQRIIDTEEFQRLDELKQLGTAKFVFRGAKHSRFEHSLGVAHLAEKLIRTLQSRQELRITEKDILCVKIAGLCHDLGHGPLSHLFDDVIIPTMYAGKIIPSIDGEDAWKWDHETVSLKLFDALLKNNNISLSDYGLNEQDKEFIKELISPPKDPQMRRGRTRPDGDVDFSKAFLYDIVNNTQSGLDVDKLDYFARDSQRVGVSDTHNYERLFRNARVCYVKKKGYEYTQICFRDKLVKDLLDVFRTRFDLHFKVYQHNTVKAIELMIRDALMVVAKDKNRTITVRGRPSALAPDGRYTITETVYDMSAFTRLTDSVVDFVANSSAPELEEARLLIRRVWNRDLYVCCGELESCPDVIFDEKDNEDRLLDEILASYNRKFPESAARSMAPQRECLPDHQTNGDSRDDGKLRKRDLTIIKKVLHWGMKNENPLAKIYTFTKDVDARAELIDPSRYETLFPKSFQKRSLLLFCKSRENQATARLAFKIWGSQFHSSASAKE